LNDVGHQLFLFPFLFVGRQFSSGKQIFSVRPIVLRVLVEQRRRRCFAAATRYSPGVPTWIGIGAIVVRKNLFRGTVVDREIVGRTFDVRRRPAASASALVPGRRLHVPLNFAQNVRRRHDGAAVLRAVFIRRSSRLAAVVSRVDSRVGTSIIIIIISLMRTNAARTIREAQLSPSDRAMRLVGSNLANCRATVQKLLIRQVPTKLMV